MQQIPFGHSTPLGAALPVAGVPGPQRPAGVYPTLPQALPGRFPAYHQPVPFYGAPTYGVPHPQAHLERPPVIAGPGALGVPAPAARGAAGGIPGVAMAPVVQVAPPAATGGPHPLPSMPEFPVPQGFPNPFQAQQLAAQPGAPAAPPSQVPAPIAGGAPGVVTVTGPMGYHPGLGHIAPPVGFGTAQTMPVPALQAAPAPAAVPAPPLPEYPPWQASSVQVAQWPASWQAAWNSAHLPVQEAPAVPSGFAAVDWGATAAQEAVANPFLSQLALQLLQHASVRTALAEAYSALTEGEARPKAHATAVAVLSGPECQAAFRDLSSGRIDQSRFIETFAVQLKGRLQSA
jgi:hypothetical protein